MSHDVHVSFCVFLPSGGALFGISDSCKLPQVSVPASGALAGAAARTHAPGGCGDAVKPGFWAMLESAILLVFAFLGRCLTG